MATYVRQQEISHPIGPRGRLRLKVTNGDVRLRPAQDEVARIRATYEISASSEGDADEIFSLARLDVSEGEDWLEARERPGRNDLGSAVRRLLSGRGSVELSVEVEAPHGAEILLETVSGDLRVEGMAGEQRYITVSGDVYATDLGGSIRLTTVSGDATLRAADRLALWCESVSGDLSATAPGIGSLRLQTVSGDIELEGRLEAAGEFRAETVSGDLTIGLTGDATFDVRGISSEIRADVAHRVEGRLDRRRLVIGGGTPTFFFSSMSGDLSVRRPRRIADVVQPAAPEPRGAGAPAVDSSLEVLRALERGEIDVEEAARRLAGRGRSDA